MTRRTTEQTYAYTGDKARGKGMGTFLKWAIPASAVLAACGPQSPTPQVEATSPAGLDPIKKDPTPNSTVEGPVSLDATPTPKIESNIPSPFEQAGLFYGSYGVDGSGKQVITGGIQNADFKANNPNSPYSVFGDENGTNVVNTLYSATNPENTAATMLDQNTLDTLLHADTSKNGITTGTLPDGTTVTKQGTSWVDDKGNVMITIVPSKEGRQFGFPLLVTDASGKLYIGITDGNGVLVEGEQFKPAFQSPSDIAKEAGFTGPQNVARVNLTNGGILQIFDNQGKLLGEVKYVGNGKTFEEQVNTAEYATPSLHDDILSVYAQAYGIEAADIELHIETKTSSEGRPLAFQVDANGVPLFMLKDGQWTSVSMRDLLDLGRGEDVALQYLGGKFSDPFAKNQSPQVDKVFGSEFNEAFLTDGWWFFTEPQEGKFNYADLVNAAKSAKEQGMFVFGGQLIDPRGEFMYGFLKDYPNISRDDLIAYMQRHIRTQMEATKGNVDAVIVVNEARHQNELIDGVPEDPFAAIIGEDYVEMAFQEARNADPAVKLIYNDSNNWYPNSYDEGYNTERTLEMIDRLKAKGLIDGVGVQMHINAANSFDVQKMLNTFKTYQEHGVPIYVTELDIFTDLVNGTPEQKARIQQELYEKILQGIIDSNNVVMVNHWNAITDDQNNQGQLFDDGLNRTANFYIEQKVIYQEIFSSE